MKRRQFFLSILSGLVCAFGLREAQTRDTVTAPSDNHRLNNPIEAQIEPLFSDVESARALGRRYLARFPDHADRALLLRRSGLADFPGDPPTEATLLKTALDHRRKQDFLAGDTVILDGWMLAQSEVCLCALLALSQ